MDWLCGRAILTSKNDRAAVINEIFLKSFKETEMEYKSIDMGLKTEDIYWLTIHCCTESFSVYFNITMIIKFKFN